MRKTIFTMKISCSHIFTVNPQVYIAYSEHECKALNRRTDALKALLKCIIGINSIIALYLTD